jgi:hypothetical protein
MCFLDVNLLLAEKQSLLTTQVLRGPDGANNLGSSQVGT